MVDFVTVDSGPPSHSVSIYVRESPKGASDLYVIMVPLAKRAMYESMTITDSDGRVFTYSEGTVVLVKDELQLMVTFTISRKPQP